MLKRIKYFQAIVRSGSFSRAADECRISQSAVSQQIKALEEELGLALFERRNKNFSLTPAGEYFYKKSLILTADYERLCSRTAKIAAGGGAVLKIGFPRGCALREFERAVEVFAAKYPKVDLRITCGNHEELFEQLRDEKADAVLSDQRRAFSDEYINLMLSTQNMYAGISAGSAIAALPSVTAEDIKDIPCILITSKGQRETEREYYQTVIGIRGDFIYAQTSEEARLLAVSGQGFIPLEESCLNRDASLRRIPLCRGKEQITRNYCLFWKKDNSGYYVEDFADILKAEFI